MELDKRVGRLEDDMKDVRERMIRMEAKMDDFVTKGDLHKAISDQTWKLVTFVCGFGTALAAAVYFIAKNVH